MDAPVQAVRSAALTVIPSTFGGQEREAINAGAVTQVPHYAHVSL